MVVSHVHHATTFIAAKAHCWDPMTIVFPHEKIAWCWLRTHQKANHFKAFPDAPKHSQMPQTVLLFPGNPSPPNKSPLDSCRFRMRFFFFRKNMPMFLFWFESYETLKHEWPEPENHLHFEKETSSKNLHQTFRDIGFKMLILGVYGTNGTCNAHHLNGCWNGCLLTPGDAEFISPPEFFRNGKTRPPTKAGDAEEIAKCPRNCLGEPICVGVLDGFFWCRKKNLIIMGFKWVGMMGLILLNRYTVMGIQAI